MAKKYVLVTGGSKGIGQAIIERCIADGFLPICVARGDYQGRNSEKVISIKRDLTEPSAAASVFTELDNRGINLDYLVNNAGSFVGKPLHELSPQEIDFQIQMNTRLPIMITKEFLLRLGAGGNMREGVVVNISSVSALSIAADTVYAATKASINGLTRCLAAHYGPKIRVNGVAPGLIPTTEMGAKVPPERAKVHIENSLTKRELKPEAIADMVSYLMSDRAQNITGVTYEVCNGSYLR
jgi:3-oxoacyl-[acyl-carrier protein] reductase